MLFTEEMPRHLRVRATRGLALFTLAGVMLGRAALASDITIANPVSGTHVSSPVWIRAHNIGCDSVPPTAFAYSIDNSTAMVRGETAYDIDVTGQVMLPVRTLSISNRGRRVAHARSSALHSP
jgi:hypothetical protein